MAKKLIAMLVMFMVVMAANNKAAEAGDLDEYKDCFDTCHKNCFQDGNGQGYTFCEMKCDTECGAKEVKGKT